ncbi:MAG: 30S ribosomal protein S13 [Candidatus Aenigmarchaeota archaeon]|nr:30S ribosomal protein S13 [Candidatus Aenigmarchaeota archaeon]
MGGSGTDKKLERKIKKTEEGTEEAKKPKYVEKKKQFNIARLMETNVNGDKPVISAINHIRGVSPMFGNAVALVFGNPAKKVADLSDAEIQKIEDIIANPQKYKIPSWLFNRRKDPETGDDRHASVSSLEFTKTMDINQMKKLRSYRGIRHMFGLPVRGQRTRSSFRKGKSVGVRRKKEAPKTSSKK